MSSDLANDGTWRDRAARLRAMKAATARDELTAADLDAIGLPAAEKTQHDHAREALAHNARRQAMALAKIHPDPDATYRRPSDGEAATVDVYAPERDLVLIRIRGRLELCSLARFWAEWAHERIFDPARN